MPKVPDSHWIPDASGMTARTVARQSLAANDAPAKDCRPTNRSCTVKRVRWRRAGSLRVGAAGLGGPFSGGEFEATLDAIESLLVVVEALVCCGDIGVDEGEVAPQARYVFLQGTHAYGQCVNFPG